MSMKSINPTTGEEIESFAPITDEELERRIAAANAAYGRYRDTSFQERGRWLVAAADILEAEKSRIGEIMTHEMGKPLKAAVAEAEKSAWVCR